MTTISAKIITHSIGTDAPRLTTLHLRYPRFIHAELMTHRVLSRNARSSRAVPIAKMIEEVENDPVIPLHWGAAQSGMQAYEECDEIVWVQHLQQGMPGSAYDQREEVTGTLIETTGQDRESAWLFARDRAVQAARAFMEAGYAKQLVNRLLEPFMHIDVLVTASEWTNFLALRDHHAAEPHIQMLARAIKDALAGSTPKRLDYHEWHLPYVDYDEVIGDVRKKVQEFTGTRIIDFGRKEGELAEQMIRAISAARCARISYKPFDSDKADIRADLDLADQLSTSGHWSPFEHQATPDLVEMVTRNGKRWGHPHLHGNLTGWIQHRKLFPNESGAAA